MREVKSDTPFPPHRPRGSPKDNHSNLILLVQYLIGLVLVKYPQLSQGPSSPELWVGNRAPFVAMSSGEVLG